MRLGADGPLGLALGGVVLVLGLVANVVLLLAANSGCLVQLVLAVPKPVLDAANDAGLLVVRLVLGVPARQRRIGKHQQRLQEE